MSGATSAGQARTQPSALVPRGSVSLTLSQLHDPDTFYRTRHGLHVWDDFSNQIIANATPVPAGTVYQLVIAELGKGATDEHSTKAPYARSSPR